MLRGDPYPQGSGVNGRVSMRGRVEANLVTAGSLKIELKSEGFEPLDDFPAPNRLRKNSIYTQNDIGIFHAAPMSKRVQDA